MKIYVHTEQLEWFEVPQNPYCLAKEISYGYLRQLMDNLLKLGLISKVDSMPSNKNRNILKSYFHITIKGQKFLKLFHS